MKRKKSYPSHKNVHLLGRVVEVEVEGIKRKKAKLNAPQYLDFFLDKHARLNDHILMVLTIKKPLRTAAQNNFLFVYLDLISLTSGHTVEELHMWVDDHILGQGITEVFGTTVRKVGHTSELNISEFCEMMNRVHEETDIPIPDPAPFKLPLTLDEYGKLKIDQRINYSKMKNRLTGKNISN